MLDRVRETPADWLNPRDYEAEYDREVARAVDFVYRLERRQTFREPENESWRAFAAGDWPRAMELIARSRPQAWSVVQRDRDAGVRTRHIRVVESPITPYVQWQMHFLQLLAKEGREVRVLRGAHIEAWEADRPLPELMLLGSHLMYEICYDATDHTMNSARCIDAPRAVAAFQADLEFLFAQGEALPDFFDREIAPLPPPGE